MRGNWKNVERRLARELGGERVGILGHEDVRHDRLSVEVKSRRELPRFIVNAYDQAVTNSRAGKMPLLILKEKSKRFADCLCILRLSDFQSLFLGGEGCERAEEIARKAEAYHGKS